MTSAAILINELSRSGVVLSKAGDQLVLDGPEAVITDMLIDRVRKLKPDILRSLDGWSIEDWRAFFNERTGIAEFDGGQIREEAEVTAFECCVVEWLNHHSCKSDPDRCAWCGDPDREGHAVVPFGAEGHGHTWLHPDCWHGWHQQRRTDAVASLCGLGLVEPFRTKTEVRSQRG
jgi:hypothetical protein